MFRKNNQHQQPKFFNSDLLMPDKMRQQLHDSWAGVFRTEVFRRIPEGRFALLYSETDSRPNAPVNVLVGGDMLKDGFGWTDEELERHLQFDLQTRYALGLDDLSQNVPTLRTFQNHRRRVREHAETTGENLYEVVFGVIT
ncbi:MAG: transposase, partial [Anaerolineales bacterium]|nr:transposase [Anaerolineales bacterium]